MLQNDRFIFLLDQYTTGNITAQEHNELFNMISSQKYDDLLGNHMLNDLASGHQRNSADLPPHIAQDIIRNIYMSEKNTIEIIPQIKRRIIGWKWMAAASIILILASASYFLLNINAGNENSLSALIPDHSKKQQNKTKEPQDISLEDGSVITLSSQSSIYYPKAFTGESREVFLEGEAFFEVAKNPEKPFLVYYNNIVTKVLGTSFKINTNNKTGNIEVSVRTGKVQVYENDQSGNEENAQMPVILSPNQKAIYKKDNRRFETTLVENPEAILYLEPSLNTINDKPAYSFIYKQEKLDNIFKQVEDVYGIEIVTENAAINNCLFTGDVSTNDLYTRLNIICLTVNATYEINGTKILIKGKGCK